MMDLLAPFCGSAKCSRHNIVFLEGVKAALTADAAWKEGWYTEKARTGPARGRTRLCRLGFFRSLPIASSSTSRPWAIPRWRISWWRSGKASSCRRIRTTSWPCCGPGQNGDISAKRDLQGRPQRPRSAAIKAKAYVMPGQTDLYSRQKDSEFEVANMPNARLVPVPSTGAFRGRAGDKSG